jgi:ring-1,2-phenylacetyl-CoA epoxidase subunit PaaE
MIKAENALGYLGFGAGQVHREIFTVSAPFRPKAGDYPVCEATILGPWGRRMVTVRSGQTILEAAEAEGWSLPYSCRSGICTTCSGHCLEGQVDMYTQEGKMDTAATRGLTLICVGYPRTKAVTIDMGK